MDSAWLDHALIIVRLMSIWLIATPVAAMLDALAASGVRKVGAVLGGVALPR